jgi:hypothetical protein
MGMKVLPFLTKWIAYERGPFRSLVYPCVNHVIYKVRPAWQLSDLELYVRADGCIPALRALGDRAEAAAPALGRILSCPTTEGTAAVRAAKVLPWLGTNGAREFVSALTNREPIVRLAAWRGAGSVHANYPLPLGFVNVIKSSSPAAKAAFTNTQAELDRAEVEMAVRGRPNVAKHH